MTRAERVYHDAFHAWETHKHDCVMCGTFGVPGCEPGDHLWTQLQATSRSKHEHSDDGDAEISGLDKALRNARFAWRNHLFVGDGCPQCESTSDKKWTRNVFPCAMLSTRSRMSKP